MSTKRILLAGAACIAAMSGGSAYAQAQVEEIVVTAQRRAENLQDVPIAIAAVTASAAEKMGVTGTESVGQLVPGLVLGRSSTSSIPFLRGIGSNFTTIGFEPSVAIFVDDVYVPSGAGTVFDFNSINSIEVLKGPQGTLFGRNATGGVLHVRTQDPTFDTDAKASAGYANYDTYSGQFYASTGLSENVAVNIAAQGNKQKEGWGKNALTGEDVYQGWGWGVRGKLLYDNHDDTTVLLNASFDKLRSGMGQGMRAVPGTWNYGPYSPDRAGLGYYDASTNFPSFIRNRASMFSAKVTHDFEVARVVSITGYGDIKSLTQNDSDASPTQFVDVITKHGEKTFTQELQLLSPVDAPIKWIIGGYYMNDVTTFDGDYRGVAVAAVGGGTAWSRQKSYSLAGFSQATAEILPRTNLTLGLRYTSDKRRFRGGNTTPVRGVQGPFFDRQSYNALTGRASLDHKFTDSIMGYIAYNRGFKSGVYNMSAVSAGQLALPAGISAQPESLNAYTVGFKSELADRRVRLNAEAYFYEFKNIQVFESAAGGAGTLITNGGGAEIKGIDVDLTVVPTERLTIMAGFAYTDGQYTSFPGGPQYFPLPPNQPIPIPQGCGLTAYPTGTGVAAQRRCDLAGNSTIRTPKFTSNLSVAYTIPTGFGSVELAGNWAHSASYFFEPDNNPFLKQPKTDLFNASIKVALEDDRFSVRVWGKNLGQEKYITHLIQSGSYYNKYSAAPPRTYGVTVSARY